MTIAGAPGNRFGCSLGDSSTSASDWHEVPSTFAKADCLCLFEDRQQNQKNTASNGITAPTTVWKNVGPISGT